MSFAKKKEAQCCSQIQNSANIRCSFNNISLYGCAANNYRPTINEETKYVIVGSITPPAHGNGQGRRGYFYSAPNNEMYKFAGIEQKSQNDIYINQTTNLVDVSKITDELLKKQIAFLDVLKCATNKCGKQNSHSDGDIDEYCIDYDAFKMAYTINPDIQYVCNSKAVYQLLTRIMNNIKCHLKIKCDKHNNNASYLTQLRRSIPHNTWYDNGRKRHPGKTAVLDTLIKSWEDMLI